MAKNGSETAKAECEPVRNWQMATTGEKTENGAEVADVNSLQKSANREKWVNGRWGGAETSKESSKVGRS